MKIPAQKVLNDYRTLREAAANGEKKAQLESAGRTVDLVSSKIDNDPATDDTIVVRSWNGAFSGPGSAPAIVTFNEVQRDGKQVLEFSAEQPISVFDPTIQRSQAAIDIESGFLLASSGTGNFVVGSPEPAVCPKPPAGPSPEEREANKIRSVYSEVEAQVSQLAPGTSFFCEALDKEVTLTQSEPGSFSLEYWGGGFSGPDSGTYVESYRRYREDGKDMLAYSKTYSGDSMTGNNASTRSRNLSL